MSDYVSLQIIQSSSPAAGDALFGSSMHPPSTDHVKTKGRLNFMELPVELRIKVLCHHITTLTSWHSH